MSAAPPPALQYYSYTQTKSIKKTKSVKMTGGWLYSKVHDRYVVAPKMIKSSVSAVQGTIQSVSAAHTESLCKDKYVSRLKKHSLNLPFHQICRRLPGSPVLGRLPRIRLRGLISDAVVFFDTWACGLAQEQEDRNKFPLFTRPSLFSPPHTHTCPRDSRL